MIAYRACEAISLPIPQEYNVYHDTMVDMENNAGVNYIIQNYSFKQDATTASRSTGISPFKKYDSSPELYNNVRIGNFVYECFGLFDNCRNFNKPIVLGNSIDDAGYMFYRCSWFNQPVEFNSYVRKLDNTFAGCAMLNSAITFNNKIDYINAYIISTSVNCKGMFELCRNFNMPFTIPWTTTDTSYMFSYCQNFNQNISIPPYVNNCVYMLSYTYNFSSHIYFLGTEERTINAQSMLSDSGHDFVNGTYANKYIHCHPNIASVIYNVPYLCGSSVSWTELGDGNGWYNSTYNVYLYNNFSGW